jgi:hypothetical protein
MSGMRRRVLNFHGSGRSTLSSGSKTSTPLAEGQIPVVIQHVLTDLQ